MEPEVRSPTVEEIKADWREFTGGSPVVGILRAYEAADVEGILWRDPDSGRTGVVTWWTDGERAEIASLHADPAGSGTGTRLMDAAEEELRRRGVTIAIVGSTNDNSRALNFYIKRGYRLVRLHLDAMDRVRELKPSVPLTGRDGVPLQEMWELEKTL